MHNQYKSMVLGKTTESPRDLPFSLEESIRLYEG